MADLRHITVNGVTYNFVDDGKLSTSLKGAASGLAELDANGKVRNEQLPDITSNVVYDSINKKITKTIDGITSDVVSIATIKADLGTFTWGAFAGQS